MDGVKESRCAVPRRMFARADLLAREREGGREATFMKRGKPFTYIVGGSAPLRGPLTPFPDRSLRRRAYIRV